MGFDISDIGGGLKKLGSVAKKSGEVALKTLKKPSTYRTAQRLIFDERPFIRLSQAVKRGDIKGVGQSLAASGVEVAALLPVGRGAGVGFKAFRASKGISVGERLGLAAARGLAHPTEKIVYRGVIKGAAKGIRPTYVSGLRKSLRPLKATGSRSDYAIPTWKSVGMASSEARGASFATVRRLDKLAKLGRDIGRPVVTAAEKRLSKPAVVPYAVKKGAVGRASNLPGEVFYHADDLTAIRAAPPLAAIAISTERLTQKALSTRRKRKRVKRN